LYDIAVEWTSPINQVVDNYACYKFEPGVKDCLDYVARPPVCKPERGCTVMGDSRQLSAEQLAEARRAYRYTLEQC